MAKRARMSARVIGFSFVALAGACDLAGAHGPAFYFLLVAVCGIAVAALGSAGDWLEARHCAVAEARSRGLVAALWSLALVLAVLGSSARSSAVDGHGLPALGLGALAASLAVFAVLGALALRGRVARPARTWG